MAQSQPITYMKIASYGFFYGLWPYAIVRVGPMSPFITGVVATQYGFDLVTLGLMLSVLTILDMLWDPTIGRLSDTVKTRWGQRKPWIVTGAVLTTAVGLALFIPRESMELWYFVLLYGLLNLVASMFQVPFEAMGTAITRDYRSRDKLFLSLPIFTSIVGLGYSFLPQLPIFETTRLTVEVFTLAVCIFGVFSLPAIWLLFRSFPEEEQSFVAASEKPVRRYETARQIWELLKFNRPFLYLIIVQIISGFGTAALGGLYFFWFDGYLGIGDAFTQISFAFVLIGFIAPLIGLQVSKFIPRRQLYVFGTLITGVNGLVLFFLTPDTPYVLPIFIICTVVISGIVSNILSAIFFAIRADVVDYGRLKTGHEGAGLYVATIQLVSKAQTAIFGGMSIAIVGYFGFVAGAETQPDEASLALRILVAGMPCLAAFITGIMMWWFPLTKKRSEIITKRLNQRAERGAGTPTAAAPAKLA